MADPAPANPGGQPENQRNEGFLNKYGGTLFRTLLMWLAMQYFLGNRVHSFSFFFFSFYIVILSIYSYSKFLFHSIHIKSISTLFFFFGFFFFF